MAWSYGEIVSLLDIASVLTWIHNGSFDIRVRTSRNRLADMVQAASKRENGALPVSEVKRYMEDLSGNIYRRCTSELLHGLVDMTRTAMRVSFEMYDAIHDMRRMEDDTFCQTVLERAQGEPHRGICDLVLLQPAVFESQRPGPGRVFCSPNCAFVISGIGSPAGSQVPETPNEDVGPQLNYRSRAFDDYGLDWGMRNNIAAIDQASSESQADPSYPLMLPVIIVNYIEAGETYWSSTHRLSVHLVSAVDHYAHLGIKDYPVWGINIGTSFAAILMAWRSATTNVSPLTSTITNG